MNLARGKSIGIGGDMPEQSTNQIKVLTDTLSRNIESFKAKRTHNRTMSFRIRMTIAAIGGLITIILGLKPYVNFENSEKIFSSIALVLSATVPLLAVWEGFFNHRWLWIRYTETLNSLYALRDELNFYEASGEVSNRQLDHIFRGIQDTLKNVDNEWVKQRNSALNRQAKADEEHNSENHAL
jgi:Protein of unknown function (DUF4231)